VTAKLQRSAWALLVVIAVGIYSVGLIAADSAPKTPDERAYSIKETTLCPICDGQNVLESNAPIATSIRARIDEWVADDRSDAEIRAELAAIFGDDVNSIPPSSGWGALVWVIPVAGTIGAAAAVVLSVRRWRDRTARRVDDEDRNLVAAARGRHP
jgi:cytochrome c-type biogenesis protein CcmH/NrfF